MGAEALAQKEALQTKGTASSVFFRKRMSTGTRAYVRGQEYMRFLHDCLYYKNGTYVLHNQKLFAKATITNLMPYNTCIINKAQ